MGGRNVQRSPVGRAIPIVVWIMRSRALARSLIMTMEANRMPFAIGGRSYHRTQWPIKDE